MSDIQLWVQSEPFGFGIVQAHPKLTKIYLKKVVSYARSKGENGGFPHLRWGIWKHMATNKMLLQENLAWGYFEAYKTVKDSNWEERLEEAELLQRSYETGEIEMYRSKVEVDTFEFLLLLFLQQAAKMSLRTSLVGEEWPGSSPRSRTPSPDITDSGKTSGIPSIFDEGNQLHFILSNLSDILELLCEPDHENKEHKSDKRLSVEAIKSLGFLIKVYTPRVKSVVPLHTLAMRHRFQNKSGFSRVTNDFSCRTFENWLRSTLEQNPFGVGACLTSGVKLKWCSTSQSGKLSVRKRSQILTNTQFAPNSQKIVYFCHCSYETIARQSPMLTGSFVKIHKCNHSLYYLLSPLRYVSIEKCQNSTFVFGPVSACIRVIGCHNVKVIAPCRSIIISVSSNVTTHLAVSTKPILIGDASSAHRSAGGDRLPMVTLGPYHTFYSQLEQHLADVGLVISPQINQWNKPICLSHTMTSRNKTGTNSAKLPRRRNEDCHEVAQKTIDDALYHIMPAADFFSFAIPFKTAPKTVSDEFTPTTVIPWDLPEEYAESIIQKQQAVSKYKTAVRTAKMTNEEKKSFQFVVENQFKQWLEQTGNKRELDDLADLTKAFEEMKKKG